MGLALLNSCSISFHHTSHKKVNAEIAVGHNFLSDLPGINGPVLSVKIDDTNSAHPQIGLTSADIVYIEQVEGGLTRLNAIFTNNLPSRIGPVRSARISDIDILSQYGHVAFAYSGAQTKFLPVIASSNLADLGAEHESSADYSRDTTRFAPYNLFLNPAHLLSQQSGIATVSQPIWNFGDTSKIYSDTNSHVVTSVSLHWPSNGYKFKWVAKTNAWEMFYTKGNGYAPDVDEKGRNIYPSNLIIQYLSITPSIYSDREGGVTPLSHVVGSGVGYLLTSGRVVPITWNRPDATSMTKYQLSNGSLVTLTPGRTWIALIDPTVDGPATFDPAIATPAQSSNEKSVNNAQASTSSQ